MFNKRKVKSIDEVQFEDADFETFSSWLSDLKRFVGYKGFNWIENNFMDNEDFAGRFVIYTDVNSYSFVYRSKNAGPGSYLGCISSARKPRAGEDWTRGNDLMDGPLTFRTWYKILADIVSYEMVTVQKRSGVKLPMNEPSDTPDIQDIQISS